MSYALLGDLKSAIRIQDTDSDGLLQVALDAATTAIDEHCNRTFTAALEATARSFEPVGGKVTTDDIYTTNGLVVAVGGVNIPVAVPSVSAGYTLVPENAAALGEPYTGLYYQSFPLAAWPLLFAVQRARVTVTARWGYAADVPAAVKMACLLQASRWFARRNSPYGIAGSPEMGSELRLLAKLDPDVAVMLAGKVPLLVGTLRDVQAGITTALGAIDGLRVYDFPSDRVEPPAAVLSLPETPYDVTLSSRADEWTFPLWVLVAKADDRAAYGEIVDYLEAEGPKSIRAIMEADRTLGGACDTVAVIRARPLFATVAGTEFLAVEFTLEVYT